MTIRTSTLIRTTVRFLPGGTLALFGSIVALAGGGLLAAFGTSGTLASGPHLISTPTTAIVSSVATIKNTSGVAAVTGAPTLRISASPVAGTGAAFVGIGPAAAVDRYLAGAATEEVDGLGIGSYAVGGIRHAGRAEVRPPTSQHFWVARSSSAQSAAIRWRIRDGHYRVVVMNADGRGGLATTSSIAVTIPNMPIYALVALLVGLLMAIVGSALLFRTTRKPPNGRTSSTPAVAVA